FWFRIHSQLAYMYEQTKVDPKDSTLNQFMFLSDSDQLRIYSENKVKEHNDQTEEENWITLSGIYNTYKFGDPYISNFMTYSGLSRYPKMDKTFYDLTVNHEGFNGINWDFRAYTYVRSGAYTNASAGR